MIVPRQLPGCLVYDAVITYCFELVQVVGLEVTSVQSVGHTVWLEGFSVQWLLMTC